MAIVKSVCISQEKGTAKQPVASIVTRENFGIEGDAHSGSSVRQVSMLAVDSVRSMQKRIGKALILKDGDFGENIVVEGIDPQSFFVGMRVSVGEALLVVSQIGKTCHKNCAIRERTGDCIMPREGVFFKVERGGKITAGDNVTVL